MSFLIGLVVGLIFAIAWPPFEGGEIHWDRLIFMFLVSGLLAGITGYLKGDKK
jgi:hypothetical protein